MKTIKKRIMQLNMIIAKCEKESAGKLYYIGRRDELNRLLGLMMHKEVKPYV